eukprot:1694212-Rhodomonas_salina.5
MSSTDPADGGLCGTSLAYAAVCLCGTDLAYAATQGRLWRTPSSSSSPVLPYASHTRCPVLP